VHWAYLCNFAPALTKFAPYVRSSNGLPNYRLIPGLTYFSRSQESTCKNGILDQVYRGAQIVTCNLTRTDKWTLITNQKLDGTRRASFDGCASTCRYLHLWPFDLISMSQAQVHTCTILVKLAEIFTKMYSPGFSGHCLLWLWSLIPKAHVRIRIHLWPKLGEIPFIGLWDVHRVFGSLSAVTLTFDFLTPKFNQHIYEPKYTCDQTWVKFPSLIFKIWCSQVFRDA